MTIPQNLGHGGVLGELTELALDFPRAYEALIGTLRFARIADPDAAHGVLHGAAMWFRADLEHPDQIALLTLSKDNSNILYTVLRAYDFNFWPTKELFVEAIRSGDLKLDKLVPHIRKFLPRFPNLVTPKKRSKSNGKRPRRHSRPKPEADIRPS